MEKSKKSPLERKSEWTFLTNHAHIYLCISENPDVKVRDLAEKVNITERAALRIIRDLKNEGYIRIEKNGRRNRYHVNKEKHLKHPLESHSQLSVLTALFSTSKGRD